MEDNEVLKALHDLELSQFKKQNMKKYNGFTYLQSTIQLEASTKDEFICILNKLKHFIIVAISEKLDKKGRNGLTDDQIQSLYIMINELSVIQLDLEDLD